LTETPELDEFERQVTGLAAHPILKALIKKGEVHFGGLSPDRVDEMVRASEAAYYFFIAAAGLNRTSLRRVIQEPEVTIAPRRLRKALAIKKRLPVRRSFAEVAHTAVALRRADLSRRTRGTIEALFRDRLTEEKIGLFMSPPVRQVPGILIARRKPDGVYPDPASGLAPKVYLEIKNVRRVADDIQKRLYEIAEASLEMKFLYGRLRIEGQGLRITKKVSEGSSALRAQLRAQITRARPAVVVLMLCPREAAERYREAAEAFIDRLFFQEEIEDCLTYLKGLLTR
jgi:hypothetical protein